MISVSVQVSGNDIASGLSSDHEEAAQMLTELADLLTSNDLDSLQGWVSDYADSMSDKNRLRLLGDLLIEAAK